MKLVKLHHDVFNLEVEVTNITSQSLRQLQSVPVCTAYTIIFIGHFLPIPVVTFLTPLFARLHLIDESITIKRNVHAVRIYADKPYYLMTLM